MESTLRVLFTSALTIMASPVNRIQESDIGKGFMAMINDVFGFLTIAGPILCVIAAMVFLIRKGMADPQDKKTWSERFNQALIAGAGIGLVSGLITLITSYFA